MGLKEIILEVLSELHEFLPLLIQEIPSEVFLMLPFITFFYTLIASFFPATIYADFGIWSIEVSSPFVGRFKWFSYFVSAVSIVSNFLVIPNAAYFILMVICFFVLVYAAFLGFWTILKLILCIPSFDPYDVKAGLCFLAIFISAPACYMVGLVAMLNSLKMYVAIM